jgi:hypothetical protein
VALVRPRVKSCEIRGGQKGAGADFLLVLQFDMPFIYSTICLTVIVIIIIIIILQGWYNRPIYCRSNSGLDTTAAPWMMMMIEK